MHTNWNIKTHSLTASMTAYSHTVPKRSHSSIIASSSHHHLSPSTNAPQVSRQSMRPTWLFNSRLPSNFVRVLPFSSTSRPPLVMMKPSIELLELSGEEQPGGLAWKFVVTIVEPAARSPASKSQIGKRREGFMHRNCRSRFMRR